MEVCSVCPYKVHHCQSRGFILTRVFVMCWLIVIFTALLCSKVSQAHPSGSENEDASGTQIQKELKEAMKELELAERLAEAANSRESRGLLKKVAFLAGMRVGGLVQSSGTLAASNSLRFFGKVVNSALSVSYGTVDELNEIPELLTVPHTVQEDRPVQEPASIKVLSVEEKPVSLSVRETEEEANKKIKANFLAGHNGLVERANANSKFLKSSRAQDFNKPTERRL